MADEMLVTEIVERLAGEVPAQTKIVLFGSQARGDEHLASDVDVLVIEPSLLDPTAESVRLRRLLGGLGIPIDVVVFERADAERRASARGTVVERALREGRVLVDT